MGMFTFSKGGVTTWAPSRGRSFPKSTPIKGYDVAEQTEDGTFQVSNYGAVRIHPVTISRLPRVDWDGGFKWASKAQVADNLEPWTQEASGGGGVGVGAQAVDSVNYKSAPNSYKQEITSSADPAWFYVRALTEIPVDRTKDYQVRCSVKKLSGTPRALCFIWEYDSNHVATGTYIYPFGNPLGLDGTMQDFMATISSATFNANTAYIKVCLQLASQNDTYNGSVVWDNISFKKFGEERELLFNPSFDLPLQSLANWFYNVAGRMLNTFTFNDEEGVAHTVRFSEPELSPTDEDNRYVDVSFELVEEF